MLGNTKNHETVEIVDDMWPALVAGGSSPESGFKQLLAMLREQVDFKKHLARDALLGGLALGGVGVAAGAVAIRHHHQS